MALAQEVPVFAERNGGSPGRDPRGPSKSDDLIALQQAECLDVATPVRGSYGAFFIPRAFGVSMKVTGSPAAAIVGFIVVYVSCLAVTWWCYARRRATMPC
jgi:NNP family nitrate/nitrite transporter-like MFS transporter